MSTQNRRGIRLMIAAGAVLVAAGFFVPGAAAVADDAVPQPKDTAATSVTVTVPAVVPTTTPAATPPATTPPATTQPSGNTPSGDGVTSGGGSPSGNGTVGRSTRAATPGGGAAVAAAPTEPMIGKTSATTAERATVDRATYAPGDAVAVSFEGFTPYENVQIVLYPGGVLIGNFPADANGRIAQSFALPSDIAPGAHTIQLTGWESKKVATVDIIVASTSAAAAPAQQGVPPWAWWAGGGLLVVLAAGGAWWLARIMRAPQEVAAA